MSWIWLSRWGIVAGILAVTVVYRSVPTNPMALIGALVIGLIGGWVGGWLANLLGLESVNWIGSLVIAFLGALIILLLLKKVAPSNA